LWDKGSSKLDPIPLKNMTKPYRDYEWLAHKYLEEELEVGEIALQANTSAKMIHEWLQRFKLYSMDEEMFDDEYPQK